MDHLSILVAFVLFYFTFEPSYLMFILLAYVNQTSIFFPPSFLLIFSALEKRDYFLWLPAAFCCNQGLVVEIFCSWMNFFDVGL